MQGKLASMVLLQSNKNRVCGVSCLLEKHFGDVEAVRTNVDDAAVWQLQPINFRKNQSNWVMAGILQRCQEV